MQAGGQLSREVQNSFRLVYCSLKDHGRQSLQGASPIEDFYEKLWRCVQPGRLYERLAKPRVEAFYSNNMSAEGFCSLLEKNVLTQNFEESGVVDICLDTFVLLDPLEQEIDRYLTRAALKQLWMVFAKLDTFRCQGLPNAEVNEILFRIANLSQLESLQAEMNKISNMELVSFKHFLNLLIANAFKLFNKMVSEKMVQDLYDGIVHEVLRTGSMRKKGHLVKNWKERFFVLTVNSLKYYETAQSLQEKGEIIINKNSSVCVYSEQSRQSGRFRVTCGSKNTATDIVTSDSASAVSWVKAIQLAINFHKVEGRNFLHRLGQARKLSSEDSSIPFSAEPLTSPTSSASDLRPQMSSNLPPKIASKSDRKPVAHSYEDLDVVDEMVAKMKVTRKGSSPDPLSTSREDGGRQFKKSSDPGHIPESSNPPLLPPKTRAEPVQELNYVDLKFKDVPVATTTGKKAIISKVEEVEYFDVNRIAKLSAVEKEDSDAKPPAVKPRRNLPQGEEKVTSGKGAIPKDGEYINLTSLEQIVHTSKASPGSSPQDKPMEIVHGKPFKREPSKDGDYVGLNFKGKATDSEAPRPIREHSPIPSHKFKSHSVDVEVKERPMMVIDSSRVSSKGDGEYIGLSFDSPQGKLAAKGQSSPILIARKKHHSKEDTSLLAPKVPAVRERPHSSVIPRESEYINILPEEASRKSHKGNHDYLMLLPGEKGSSSGTKRSDNKDYINLETVEDTRSKPPPPKPLPYHQTRHAYVNTTSATVPESQPPVVPPRR